MSIPSTGLSDHEKSLVLVVTTKEAQELLRCGKTEFYRMLAAGELQSYLDGDRRKISYASIQQRVAKKLAESKK